MAKIPEDERFGQALKSGWCSSHGDEFCNAILAGETKREGLTEAALHGRNLLASGSTEKIAASKRRQVARVALRAEFTVESARQLSTLLEEQGR